MSQLEFSFVVIDPAPDQSGADPTQLGFVVEVTKPAAPAAGPAAPSTEAPTTGSPNFSFTLP